MLYTQINRKIKAIKAFVLQLMHDFLEPTVWEELSASISADGRENYLILDDDFPDIRDLKAFLNMLTAIERATESYSLIAVSIFKKMELPNDILEFRRNYKIYMSTNGILSQHLALAKEFIVATLFPILGARLNEVLQLCTGENVEKATEFLIEQVINLEQYQEKYREKKRKAAENKEEVSEEGFVSKLVKKNDVLLKKIYGEKYDTHFVAEAKDDLKGYYPENKNDNETIKNLKKLTNGIIGIQKVLDDFAAINQAGMISTVSCITVFALDLRQVYRYLQGFDYQAIIAEQTNPIAEKIKTQITQLYDSFEKLSCIADQFEGAYSLKEGILLRYVELILQRYKQIASELKISIDYTKQKRIFHKARMQAREQGLRVMQAQLDELNRFMPYHDHPLAHIPAPVLCAMQQYIIKHHGIICMDRHHLAQYEKYLADAINNNNNGIVMMVMCQVEFWANRAGITRHAEMMDVLKKQQRYLEKQKLFLQKRLQHAQDGFTQNPYDHFKLSEIDGDIGPVVLDKLKTHLVALDRGKDDFFNTLAPDEKKRDKGAKPQKFSERLQNQMLSKVRELGVFRSAIARHEKENTVPALQILVKSIENESCLSPGSLVLLEEIKEIMNARNDSSSAAPSPSI